MKSILASFNDSDRNNIAIQTANTQTSYADLIEAVEKLVTWLLSQNITSVSIHAQNSLDWVVIDLACQRANIILTPIPLFFSEAQFKGVLSSVKPDLIFSDSALPYEQQACPELISLSTYRLSHTEFCEVPISTAKVTYTSGSTGVPKGVCLSTESQLMVALSLVDTIGINHPKHLCLLPLPTLLENIAGIYAPLLAGGTVVLASDKERGFKGSKLVNPQALLSCISHHTPNTLILVPELLQILLIAAKQGWQPPSSLQFIAVGGSKIAASMISEARKYGLPVYQGYGLSECCSVVSLCSATDDVKSTGKLLPHIHARIENNELIVKGNIFLGYLEDTETWYQNEVRTGDLATLAGDTLYIDGRLKNTIINSFGRNISPEWIESELLSTGLFYQAVVVGDCKPFCTAILVPISDTLSTGEIIAQVNQLNNGLPDYAQIKSPIILTQPMSHEQGLYTENMRPKRMPIDQYFKHDIERVYSQGQA